VILESSTNAAAYANPFAFKSAGNLGIGTTTPHSNAGIEIYSSSAVTSLALFITNSNTTVNNYEAILFNTLNSSAVQLNVGGVTVQNTSHTAGAETADMFFSVVAAGTMFERVRITSSGNVSIGIGASPTAVLHLKAGTATANTAPLQFNSGTVETTARAGLHEYDGNHRLTNVALLRLPVGGALFDHFADVSVGGAEADIYTDTLLANTFNANGDKVTANYGGNFVTVGTELTQLKVYLAGTAIWDSTGVAPTTGTTSWNVDVKLIRVSSTIVRYTVTLNTTGASGFVYATVGELTGLTLSGTNILKITGTSSGVGSGAGDIVGKMGFVSFSPAA
jgi:hypothetical protein